MKRQKIRQGRQKSKWGSIRTTVKEDSVTGSGNKNYSGFLLFVLALILTSILLCVL